GPRLHVGGRDDRVAESDHFAHCEPPRVGCLQASHQLASNRARTEPKPSRTASYTPPGSAATIGPSAPDRIRSPARSGWPSPSSVLASQTTAFTGWPRHAEPRPVDTTPSG